MSTTSEVQGDGRPTNLPGVYRREDGKEIATTTDPDLGRVQADAIVQQGFKYAGPHSILEEKDTPKK